MDALLSSGRLIDVALAVLGLELVGLFVWRARREGGLRPADVVGQLLAGGLLLAAVRCEASGADPRWTLGLLMASFPAHLYDLIRRARRAARA
ncbi:MAG TPA: hypothetical protein RMH99_05030 [Sandaracinaceae bacterium LLY-WYZ-13_1]|nr:hypothetical protein [Sandaracinaceae bacterium LLY-WYZ-13_1]